MCKMLMFLNKPSANYIKYYSTAVPKATKNKWKSVVGLEVHAQIATESKLFSGSKVVFGAPLNSCVSEFDASIPGTLPVLNQKCVEAGIKTALAFNCIINPVSMFDRKHYFYADMPAGYQITQQRSALANSGSLSFPVFIPGLTKKPYEKTVRLHQLQLEQDSGKSLHDDVACRSLVDLNRAGIPLMELVFEPDLKDGEEAAALIKELVLILKRLGTCSCRMEEGALRVDANVSIHQPGEPYGTRTEIKNIGSVRGVAQAITYEIHRQEEIKDSGGNISNETRSWDAVNRKTIAMRDKEVQQDYRFMPEPNLPPLRIDIDGKSKISNLVSVPKIADSLPELPEDTRKNLIESFGLTQEIAIILVNEPSLLEYFLQIKEDVADIAYKTIANFLINDLLTLCNKNNVGPHECKITSKHLVDLMSMLQSKTINIHLARIVLEKLYIDPEKSTLEIAEEYDLKQINDPQKIIDLCEKAIAKNSKAVEQYRKGKKKVLYAIVGDVAKLSNNRANMELVVEKLEELLR